MKIPVTIYFSDDVRGSDPLQIAERLPKDSTILFRHYNIENRAEIAHELAKICKKCKINLLISQNPELANIVGASGCHLPGHMIHQAPTIRLRFPNLFLSAACHSETDLLQAGRLKIDCAILSPIFPTASHPGAPALGASRAALMTRRSSLPVFALGGVDKQTYRQLHPMGFAGFGAVTALEDINFAKKASITCG